MRLYGSYRDDGRVAEPSKALDSSLKRHTALIKRMRQSLGIENRDQIIKDIDSLTLEKYVDEKPERRTFDGLSNFEPVTKPVKEFTQNEFEGWGTEFAPGEGYDYSWSGIIGDVSAV